MELEVVYSALPWHNAFRGIRSGSVYMDNADVTATINFDRIFNLEDKLSLFVYGLGNHGGQATALMGDYQVASNIEAVRTWRLFEAWVQHNFIKDRISILVGLYDLNSEFDILKPGTLFINSSFGIGAEYAQSGRNGPSIFPVSSFGVRFATLIAEHIRFRMAVLDGVPGDPHDLKSNKIILSPNDGVLLAAEAAIYTGRDHEDLSHVDLERGYVTRRRKVGREYGIANTDKINIGWWYYIDKFMQINDSTDLQYGNAGAYIGMQRYFTLGSEEDFIALFVRYGIANAAFNRFGSAISAGVVVSNPIFKTNDSIGLAFSSGINGSVFREIQENSSGIAETVLELTYAIPVGSWLLVQPDVQYIFNPSTRADLDNPLSFGLLLQLSLNAN